MEKKVSVKFNCHARWAVSIREQVEFVKDQVIDNLPISFSDKIVRCGQGEIVSCEEVNSSVITKAEDDELEQRYIDKEHRENLLIYSELYSLKIDRVKEIAKLLDIDATTKSKTINRILDEQFYDKDFLGGIDSKEIIAICRAKGVDFEDKKSAELVEKILEDQDEKE